MVTVCTEISLHTVDHVGGTDIVHGKHTVNQCVGDTPCGVGLSRAHMNTVTIEEKLNTHQHGHLYHNRIGKIGMEIGMEYNYMNTIIRKLFDKNFKYTRKILSLEPREIYTFVINNADRLKHIFREAMATELSQLQLDIKSVSKVQFCIPQSCLFTYDAAAKTQLEMKKNLYLGYLSSAEVRSSSERKFEKYCEHADSVDWVYKNDDKGNEYLSVVYADNSEKQKKFYPDYIISVRGKIWIIETKGGFDHSGNSQDIDIFTPKKFAVLKDYLKRYGLNGGIVHYDKKREELCICMGSYSDDIGSNDWKLLSKVID